MSPQDVHSAIPSFFGLMVVAFSIFAGYLAIQIYRSLRSK